MMRTFSKRCVDLFVFNRAIVVDDQKGCPTFTSDMVEAIFYLRGFGAIYCTYRRTGSECVTLMVEIRTMVSDFIYGIRSAVHSVMATEHNVCVECSVLPS